MMSQGYDRHLLGLLTAGVVCGTQTRSFTTLLKGGAISHDTIETVFLQWPWSWAADSACFGVHFWGCVHYFSMWESYLWSLFRETLLEPGADQGCVAWWCYKCRGLSTSGRRAAKPGATMAQKTSLLLCTWNIRVFNEDIMEFYRKVSWGYNLDT